VIEAVKMSTTDLKSDHNSVPAADTVADKAAPAPSSKPARFLCKAEVLDRVGLSYTTVWDWMRQGRFPRSRELGGRRGWLESEIEEWMANVPLSRLKGDR
jgi:prophage regulatory protein